MQLLNDIHHLTFITADMNRLICFYERIFGARVTVDLEEEGLRHAFIEHHNANPKPFRWTSADDILSSIERFCACNSPTRA